MTVRDMLDGSKARAALAARVGAEAEVIAAAKVYRDAVTAYERSDDEDPYTDLYDTAIAARDSLFDALAALDNLAASDSGGAEIPA